MDKALKQRLVGATVLIILAVIVLPMLLSGRSDTLSTESRQIELPPRPEELSFETRRFPVGVPDKPAVQKDLPPAVPVPAEDAIKDSTATSIQPAIQPEPAGQGGELALTGADDVDAEGVAGSVSDADQLAEAIEKPPVVTKVIIEPRENPKGVDPDTTVVSPGGSRYLVQVASFSSEKRANTLAAELRAGNLPVVMDVVERTAGRLHRVRVGPYAERSGADAVVKQVRTMNKDLRPRVMDTRPDEAAPVSAPSDPLVRWVVQLGSYNNSAAADAQVAKLRLAGMAAFTEKVTSAGSTTYKVCVGPEIDRSKAVQLKQEIKTRHGIDGFVKTQE